MKNPPKKPGASENDKKNANQTGAEGGQEGNENQEGEGSGDEGGNENSTDENQESGNDEDPEKVDLSKLPAGAQKLIKKLRSENASQRTKAKLSTEQHAKLKGALVEAGLIEDDSIAPEEQVKNLTAQTGQLQLKNAILDACVEHGVGKDAKKYFEFLVSQELDALEEDQEISEDRLGELALEAKNTTAKKAPKSSSVNESGKKDGQQNPPAPESEKGETTLEQFVKMNVLDKSRMYQKNPDLYKRLSQEAKDKRLLIG